MQFSTIRPPRRPRENIVPMINVVFLLLIFFLMTAQIAPPVPFDVDPPTSESRQATEAGPAVLHVSSEGRLFFQGAEDDAVWPALAAHDRADGLLIRADARLGAVDLTRLLGRLGEIGLDDMSLVSTSEDR